MGKCRRVNGRARGRARGEAAAWANEAGANEAGAGEREKGMAVVGSKKQLGRTSAN